MLNMKNVTHLQTTNGVADGAFSVAEVSFKEYVTQCRVYTKNNIPEGYTNDQATIAEKRELLNKTVSTFVELHKLKVKGYVSPDGIVDLERLLADVINDVTGVSILKEALEDETVDEIQINDKDTIFVQRNGMLYPYVDKQGRLLKFSDNLDIHIVLNKLIDDGTGNLPQFTQGNPLFNAKTAEAQYRINAVHYEANSRQLYPYNFQITNVTLRKFKEVKLTLEDVVGSGAMTDEMGRLCKLIGLADLRAFCVGATGSGKTTLLNIIANEIPMDKRIILIQNPTEISFYKRDQDGRMVRNVVHHEVIQKENSKASLELLVDNSMRETPEVLIIGEMRLPKEFEQGYRAGQTGHPLLSGYHGKDVRDGLGRFATELSSATGMSNTECLRLVCNMVDIIIAQKKLRDGSRKIIEIAEIKGVDDDNVPIINMLYEFVPSGKTEAFIDDKGYTRKRILGSHRRVGAISKELQKELFFAGVDEEELKDFIKPVEPVTD